MRSLSLLPKAKVFRLAVLLPRWRPTAAQAILRRKWAYQRLRGLLRVISGVKGWYFFKRSACEFALAFAAAERARVDAGDKTVFPAPLYID